MDGFGSQKTPAFTGRWLSLFQPTAEGMTGQPVVLEWRTNRSRKDTAMHVDLEPDEIEALIESLDCLKTKIAFVKGDTYEEKTAKLARAEALEQKLRRTLPPA